MSNHIFKSILLEQADIFFSSFLGHSRTRSTNPTSGRLTNTAMFGSEREKVARDFLGLLSPSGIILSNNMKVITPFEKESTECDIVLYDSYNATMISAKDHKYVPIECVSSIIEVKSILDKTSFKKALRKLAESKCLRSDLAKFEFRNKKSNERTSYYYSSENPKDQIFTILICESFDFDLMTIDFEDIYSHVPVVMRHNLIFSLKDGTFFYKSPLDGVLNPWPCLSSEIKSIPIFSVSNYSEDDDSLFQFCQMFNLGLRTTSIFDLEIIRYMKSP